MSGHSKWSTIKRKKGAADAKRGAVFTRLSKDITLAAREGGGDMDMNPALRLVVKKAKVSNMPASNIDRALKKGTGDLPGVVFENFIYEGYGPNGVAIMMEVMTDNKNRTVPDIRHIMTKNGGNLGESGCVSWMFEKKGTVTVKKTDIDEESIMDLLIELGIEDYDSDDDYYEVVVPPEVFGELSEKLEQKNLSIDGELGLVPINMVKVSELESEKILKLLDILEEHDDIQKLYTNFEVE